MSLIAVFAQNRSLSPHQYHQNVLLRRFRWCTNICRHITAFPDWKIFQALLQVGITAPNAVLEYFLAAKLLCLPSRMQRCHGVCKSICLSMSFGIFLCWLLRQKSRRRHLCLVRSGYRGAHRPSFLMGGGWAVCTSDPRGSCSLHLDKVAVRSNTRFLRTL